MSHGNLLGESSGDPLRIMGGVHVESKMKLLRTGFNTLAPHIMHSECSVRICSIPQLKKGEFRIVANICRVENPLPARQQHRCSCRAEAPTSVSAFT